MNAMKLVAVALIIVGALALTYGGFSYPKAVSYTHLDVYKRQL